MSERDPSIKTFQSHDGLTLAWYELASGNAGAPDGPPIILQHGFTSTAHREWVECGIVEKLTALGRPIFGIDARGHGASDKPHDPDYYGEANMARDVVTFANHIGLTQYDFAGYSMGGVTAAILGTIDQRVRRLVISGVGEAVALYGGVEQRVFDRGELARALRADDASGFAPVMQEWRAGIEERGGDLLAMAAHADNVHNQPIPLDTITAKTMVMAGDADPLAPNPHVLAAAISGATTKIVPGDHGEARLSAEFADELLAFFR